jgi:hypothetical protein
MPGSDLEWRDITVPAVILHEPQGDGLEIHVRSRGVTHDKDDGIRYAVGQVVTIVRGTEQRHENVLIGTKDPTHLANLLAAGTKSAVDRTVSLFDDGMTIRIERSGPETWTLICRPISLPPSDATWKTFPEFSFTVGSQTLQQARRELGQLAGLLHER